ncbi:hypothetical protein [Streptomyces sp. NPDC018972]|uniref:hypothetical protein n=1 Tax=Streptomyces sp. NPDC018972 TaxID=3365060 RepID=UPI0037B59499
MRLPVDAGDDGREFIVDPDGIRRGVHERLGEVPQADQSLDAVDAVDDLRDRIDAPPGHFGVHDEPDAGEDRMVGASSSSTNPRRAASAG